MIKLCDWCGKDFEPNVSYQIYCTKECRDESTKEKVSERYLATRVKNRIGKDRKCKGQCGTLLSIYNNTNYCVSCAAKQDAADKALRQMKGLIDFG